MLSILLIYFNGRLIFIQIYWNSTKYIHTSMAQCKTAVSPVLMHWRYCSFALSHEHVPLTESVEEIARYPLSEVCRVRRVNPCCAECIAGNICAFSNISQHKDDEGGQNPSPWKTRSRAADLLATQGARASAAMLLLCPEYSGFSSSRVNITFVFKVGLMMTRMCLCNS